jgi:hypothetical protein
MLSVRESRMAPAMLEPSGSNPLGFRDPAARLAADPAYILVV